MPSDSHTAGPPDSGAVAPATGFRPFGIARFLLATVLVGVAGGGFAIVFRLLLHHGLALVVGNANVLAAFEALPLWQRLLFPAAGGLAAGIVTTIAARGAGGHGVAEVLEAVALGRGEISLVSVLWKSLASLFAIVGGGSIGREGSIIQFGAGSGSTLGRWLGLDARQRRTLVAAGTAAGFAAAYNTPIAAVIFVLEVVTGVVNLEIALPVMTAATLATVLTRMALGHGPLYGARVFALASRWEFLAYVLLGIVAGVAGPAFMRMLHGGERVARRVGGPRWLRAAIGGLGVGALAMALPSVTGNGYEAIQRILNGEMMLPLLLVLVLAKPIATVSSVSSGSPGGVFTPTLFLGAALGGVFGTGVARFFPATLGHPLPGAYALVGMAALTAATTHAPLMAATLAFELSGDYEIVLPLLLATSVAAVLSRRLHADSIYTEELARRGIPWRGNLTERIARAVRAADILTLDPPTVLPETSLAEVSARMAHDALRAVYVIAPGPRILRIDVNLALRATLEASMTAHAVDLGEPVEPIFSDATLIDLSERLWAEEWGEVPIVDRTHPGVLRGIVTRRDVLGALDREILQRDILLTRVVRFETAGERADFLELPAGRRVELIAAPPSRIGKRIDPNAIRTEFGVVVLAVRRGGRHKDLIDPSPEYRLHERDRLLVLGSRDGIDRLRHDGRAHEDRRDLGFGAPPRVG